MLNMVVGSKCFGDYYFCFKKIINIRRRVTYFFFVDNGSTWLIIMWDVMRTHSRMTVFYFWNH